MLRQKMAGHYFFVGVATIWFSMNIDKIYNAAYKWLLTYGPKILLAIIILMVGQWLIRIVRNWLSGFFKASRFDSVRPFLKGMIGLVLQVLLVLVIMQVLGIQMTIFAAVVASFGVAAGLALSGTLQNFASGVLILILKPYRIGDNIISQGMEGTVTAIQLFHTIVTSFDNKTVIVPNSKLSNETIVNLSRQGQRRIDIELKFNYGIDFEQVKKTVENTIDSADDLLASPKSRIGILQLEADGYKVMVNVWVNAHGFLDAKLLFQESLLNGLKQSGIKLPGM